MDNREHSAGVPSKEVIRDGSGGRFSFDHKEHELHKAMGLTKGDVTYSYEKYAKPWNKNEIVGTSKMMEALLNDKVMSMESKAYALFMFGVNMGYGRAKKEMAAEMMAQTMKMMGRMDEHEKEEE